MTVSPYLSQIRTVIGVSINGFKEIEILSKGIVSIIKNKSWTHIADRKGKKYESFEELVTRPAPDGMGTTISGLKGFLANYPKAIEAIDSTIVIKKKGTNQHTTKPEGSDIIRPSEPKEPSLGKVAGTSRDYLAARLRRDHPDIAAEVSSGALSARAGAIKAGIIKVPTPLEKIQAAFSKLSQKDRKAFDKWRASL